MSDVTRHDFICFPSGRVIELDREEGKYVLHSNYSALLARHNALVEAVENERRLETAQDDFDAPDDHFDAMTAARAEVDRLIATDCKGEG